MPRSLREIARSQAGVITRKQAIRAGMSSDAIEWKLRLGTWRRFCRGVYATFTGPVSRRAQLWAAVLYAGQGALLSHETAGELQKLVDKPGRVIHVTVPASRRVTPVSGLAVHVSDQALRLPYPPGALPVTFPEDTILDLAQSAASLDDMYGLVTRAFGREVTGEVKLRIAMCRRGRLRWRRELEEIIAAAAGGAHSPLEFRWDRDVERAHGLPPSRHQVPFVKKDGRRGYRDRVFESWGVIVELDGKRAHPDEERWADKRRDNAAAEDGGQSLRYGWKEVRWEPCDTAVQVVRVLWQRGWDGDPCPCTTVCPVARLLREKAA